MTSLTFIKQARCIGAADGCGAKWIVERETEAQVRITCPVCAMIATAPANLVSFKKIRSADELKEITDILGESP